MISIDKGCLVCKPIWYYQGGGIMTTTIIAVVFALLALINIIKLITKTRREKAERVIRGGEITMLECD